MPRSTADVLSLLRQGDVALSSERSANASQVAKAKADLDAAVAAQKAADQTIIDGKDALLVKANDAIATLTQDKATLTQDKASLQTKLDAAVLAAQMAADQVPDLVAAAVQAFVGTVLAGNAVNLPPAEPGETLVGS